MAYSPEQNKLLPFILLLWIVWHYVRYICYGVKLHILILSCKLNCTTMPIISIFVSLLIHMTHQKVNMNFFWRKFANSVLSNWGCSTRRYIFHSSILFYYFIHSPEVVSNAPRYFPTSVYVCHCNILIVTVIVIIGFGLNKFFFFFCVHLMVISIAYVDIPHSRNFTHLVLFLLFNYYYYISH